MLKAIGVANLEDLKATFKPLKQSLMLFAAQKLSEKCILQ